MSQCAWWVKKGLVGGIECVLIPHGTHHAHFLQGQVSDSLAESRVAHCSVAVVFQLLGLSCSHNDVALGACRDRVGRQLQLLEDIAYSTEAVPTPAPPPPSGPENVACGHVCSIAI